MPADASSPIPLAFDRLRQHPGAVPKEIPGLLERLAEVPDPRDPRWARHALVAVLALTACAVLAGATSLLAVGEWITDVPPSAFHRGLPVTGRLQDVGEVVDTDTSGARAPRSPAQTTRAACVV
ncbi:transposase family protein [Streptomyces misionensis]|uniref:transposase family protein n=1 Tax=Streptomyces misionensis TaxID=67331 RepID=UPI0034119CE9